MYVTLRDDLDEVNPGYLTYVDQSATLNGFPAGVDATGTVITADYFAEYGALPPGEFAVLRFRAVIDPALVEGTAIVNTGRVYWDDPQQQAEATVMIDVGAMPDAGMLSGYVWHDADHDNVQGGLETPLAGWSVELLLDDQPVRSVTTDADGYYLFINVTPNYATGQFYSLRFSAPGAGSTTAVMGDTDSDFTDGPQRIDEIDVQEGVIKRRTTVLVAVVEGAHVSKIISGRLAKNRHRSPDNDLLFVDEQYLPIGRMILPAPPKKTSKPEPNDRPEHQEGRQDKA